MIQLCISKPIRLAVPLEKGESEKENTLLCLAKENEFNSHGIYFYIIIYRFPKRVDFGVEIIPPFEIYLNYLIGHAKSDIFL